MATSRVVPNERRASVILQREEHEDLSAFGVIPNERSECGDLSAFGVIPNERSECGDLSAFGVIPNERSECGDLSAFGVIPNERSECGDLLSKTQSSLPNLMERTRGEHILKFGTDPHTRCAR